MRKPPSLYFKASLWVMIPRFVSIIQYEKGQFIFKIRSARKDKVSFEEVKLNTLITRPCRRTRPYVGKNRHVLELTFLIRRIKLSVKKRRASCLERVVSFISEYSRFLKEHNRN